VLLCRSAYDEEFCLMQFFTLLVIIHNDYDYKPEEYLLFSTILLLLLQLFL